MRARSHSPWRIGLPIAVTALAAGCFPTVDVDKTDLDGYSEWFQVQTQGKIPNHGDSYRVIYVNEVALEYGGAGDFPTGSVLVKEIYELDDDGGPGPLDYISVMRRLDEPPPGGQLDDGWLFTLLEDGIEGDEVYLDSCWSKCHVAAPHNGVFLRYGL